MEVIDKILNEWSFRCHDGIVDINNPEKKAILDSILKEYNIGLNEVADSSKIDDIIFTLQKANVRKEALETIKNKLLSYSDSEFNDFSSNFRKYNVDQIDEIFKHFKDFYNITFKGLGRGEIMIILGLKDSKSGGTSTKDIEVNGKIYEVKELAGGEFSLGSDGYVTGTDYLTHLTSFKQYLTPGVVTLLDLPQKEADIILKTINYYTENGPSNASRGFINTLTETCRIIKENISNVNLEKLNYISIGGKQIAVSDEDYEKIKAGSGPVTISFGEEIDESRINLNKLKIHPWISDPDQVKIDLYEIWEAFLKKLDGMILFNYPSKPEGILMNINEIDKNFIPFRIVQNSLLAKDKSSVKKEKDIIEEEN